MAPTTVAGYALLALLATVGLLLVVSIVVMRLLRRGAPSAGRRRDPDVETTLLSDALRDAVDKLKAQERAAAARADASQRLASRIIDGLPSGLVVVDCSGHIQAMNAAARRLLLLDDLTPGVALRDALASTPELADVIAEALRTGSLIARRSVALARRVGPSHLGVTVSPIRDGEGNLEADVCLFTDLTRVVELEEQLRLKEALARLGELTAGLAHEFRNGLATIHGYGRLLDPAVLTASQASCVEGIRAETVALGEIVTNFLRFARPEPLTLSPVDLRAVIARSVDDVAGGSGALRLDGAYETIDGDDVLLRQAFSNLFRNSLDACASVAVEPLVTVNGVLEEREILVTVDDNGPGLDDETLRRLFQPFVTTKANGTGLGLAIVQKIIVSHNGRIAAGNRQGGGAQFRIRLPRRLVM